MLKVPAVTSAGDKTTDHPVNATAASADEGSEI